MKKKLYTVLTMACLLLISSVSLVACGHEHDYASVWSKDKTHHWHECTIEDCEEVSDKAEHTASDWIIDTQATHATDGTKHKECTECGYIMDTTTITATGLSIWNGTVGTVGNAVSGVIEINSAEELAGIASAVNNGTTYEGVTLKLMYNIDLNGNAWTPIGDSSRKVSENTHKFMGTFDGNGKYIIGLTNSGYTPSSTMEENDDLDTYGYGLFGYTENATIKDLTITVNINTDATALKGDSVGAIVGYAKGGLNLSNCVVNGTVNGGFDAVGGLVGRAYYSTTANPVIIENCTNNANVSAMSKVAGVLGFITHLEECEITSCINNGNITSTGANLGSDGKKDAYVSGIVNYAWRPLNQKVVVSGCNNTGDLYAMSETDNGDDRIGVSAIANLTSHSAQSTYTRLYDFMNNVNSGNVYVKGLAVEDYFIASFAQVSFSGYSEALEYNNKTNIATSANE